MASSRSSFSATAIAVVSFILLVLFSSSPIVSARPDPNECEVCISVLNKIAERTKGEKDLVAIESKIAEYCEKPATEKDTKLCYYIDPIKREVSQPMKNGVPVDVICQRLKKKSAEICALKYAASAPASPKIDLTSDFTALKIGQLKAFMAEKGWSCNGCIEKADYVANIKKNLQGKEL